MYRFLLVLAFLFWINFGFSRIIPKQLPKVDTATSTAVVEIDSTISDSMATTEKDSRVVQPNKTKEDDVDKESVGYKVGYQIGSWLIPGILMVIVTVMIARRARKGRDQNPEL